MVTRLSIVVICDRPASWRERAPMLGVLTASAWEGRRASRETRWAPFVSRRFRFSRSLAGSDAFAEAMDLPTGQSRAPWTLVLCVAAAHARQRAPVGQAPDRVRPRRRGAVTTLIRRRWPPVVRRRLEHDALAARGFKLCSEVDRAIAAEWRRAGDPMSPWTCCLVLSFCHLLCRQCGPASTLAAILPIARSRGARKRLRPREDRGLVGPDFGGFEVIHRVGPRARPFRRRLSASLRLHDLSPPVRPWPVTMSRT